MGSISPATFLFGGQMASMMPLTKFLELQKNLEDAMEQMVLTRTSDDRKLRIAAKKAYLAAHDALRNQIMSLY